MPREQDEDYPNGTIWENEKVKIFNDEPFKIWTHYDLDGVGGPMLLKEFYGRQVTKTTPMGHGKMDAYIEKNDGNIIITDLSLTQEQVDRANEKFNKVILFDHHPTSLTIDYPDHWTTYLSTKCCATKLIYHWLRHNGWDVSRTKTFVDHVDDYDSWIHKIPACRPLNSIFWHLNFWKFEKAFANFTWDPELWKKANELMDVMNKEISEFETYLIEDTLRIVIADKHVSDISLYYTDQEHFLIMKEKTASVRSTIDMMDFYTELNELGFEGGGHANAGGINFKGEPIVIIELFLNYIKKRS